MKVLSRIITVLVVFAALTACQSTETKGSNAENYEFLPISPKQSFIQTEVRGFSPTANFGWNTIEFALYFANARSVKTWKVSMESEGIAWKTFTGTSADMPPTITWDGKGSSNSDAPNGIYNAKLEITYDKDYTKGTARSTQFILESTAPTGDLVITPSLYSLENPDNVMTIKINGKSSLAKIESWTMRIFDPGWNLFRTYSGKWPNNTVVWNGRNMKDEIVVSAEDYPVVVELRDEFGNTGTIESILPIDIIVIKDGDGYRIENSRIYFQNFTANYKNVPAVLARQNKIRLDRLAETFKKYPDHKVNIVGHAVMIFWEDKELGAIEQRDVLIPLSLARAKAIKEAMIERGVKSDRITTEGAGANDPIVPNSDYQNRWINRRTAFYLVK